MKKILCYICEHLRIVATTIYSLILIIIFLFPPLEWGGVFFGKFIYVFSSKELTIYQPIFYSEIIVVSLIYFAFMLFVIKKWKKH